MWFKYWKGDISESQYQEMVLRETTKRLRYLRKETWMCLEKLHPDRKRYWSLSDEDRVGQMAIQLAFFRLYDVIGQKYKGRQKYLDFKNEYLLEVKLIWDTHFRVLASKQEGYIDDGLYKNRRKPLYSSIFDRQFDIFSFYLRHFGRPIRDEIRKNIGVKASICLSKGDFDGFVASLPRHWYYAL